MNRTCRLWYVTLLPAALAFFPDLFTTRIPVKVSVHFTTSYVPAVLQVVAHILIQLDNQEGNIYKTLPPVVINHREENGTVHLEFIDHDVKADKYNIKLLRRKLNHLITILNTEAQKQQLDAFQGMAESVMINLHATSTMTARQQLKYTLTKVLESEITEITRKEVQKIAHELQEPMSELSVALRELKALPYVP